MPRLPKLIKIARKANIYSVSAYEMTNNNVSSHSRIFPGVTIYFYIDQVLKRLFGDKELLLRRVKDLEEAKTSDICICISKYAAKIDEEVILKHSLYDMSIIFKDDRPDETIIAPICSDYAHLFECGYNYFTLKVKEPK